MIVGLTGEILFIVLLHHFIFEHLKFPRKIINTID